WPDDHFTPLEHDHENLPYQGNPAPCRGRDRQQCAHGESSGAAPGRARGLGRTSASSLLDRTPLSQSIGNQPEGLIAGTSVALALGLVLDFPPPPFSEKPFFLTYSTPVKLFFRESRARISKKGTRLKDANGKRSLDAATSPCYVNSSCKT